MKVAIISDLHSNREALEAVFAHIQTQGVSTVYCLGDVIGYGPEPEFCVDMVRGHATLCLMGNHDEALFRDASDFNPHAREAIEFTRARMEREPGHRELRASQVPLGRWGKPEEVAAAVLFLASTEATFVHGSNLVIDGGYIIH